MKKRTRLLIAAAALALLVALLCILLGNHWVTGGKGTPYPYAYQIQRDGTVRLRITEDTTDGYSWKPETAGAGSVTLSAPDIGEKTTEFLVTPQEQGAAHFTLQHRREATLLDGDYAFDFMVFASETAHAEFLNGQGRKLEPVREQTSPAGYTLRSASEQPAQWTFLISSPKQTPCVWTVEAYDETLVLPDRQTAKDGSLVLQLYCLNPGTTGLRVVGRPLTPEREPDTSKTGLVYTCQMTISELGAITIEDETLEEFTDVVPGTK